MTSTLTNVSVSSQVCEPPLLFFDKGHKTNDWESVREVKQSLVFLWHSGMSSTLFGLEKHTPLCFLYIVFFTTLHYKKWLECDNAEIFLKLSHTQHWRHLSTGWIPALDQCVQKISEHLDSWNDTWICAAPVTDAPVGVWVQLDTCLVVWTEPAAQVPVPVPQPWPGLPGLNQPCTSFIAVPETAPQLDDPDHYFHLSLQS